MKLYIQILKLLFNKYIRRKSNGFVVRQFAEEMGLVYIKFAQILATQNYGDIFTENDRKILSSICDNCNPIPYHEIEKILKNEYGEKFGQIFYHIEKEPIGSASVSQVHKAVLNSGEEVAIKVKRKDVTASVENDIEKLRKIVHKFGKLVKFRNFTGGDYALNLYLEWIKQEVDFNCEKENIKEYQNFADSVNGKVPGTSKIKVPRLYDDLCTDNIIVMEFIKHKTINQLELTEEDKNKVMLAINSYIKLSFWAMLNNKKVVFHGDPHGGNICIDDENNIYFLDMGLLFTLSPSDSKLCQDLFLTAYSGNYEKLYNLLICYGNMNEKERKSLKESCQKYCEGIMKKDITHCFTDLLTVLLGYEFVPPDFLFSMSKTFICLNGIFSFCNNQLTAKQLLQEQIVEYMVKRSLQDCQGVMVNSIHIAPQFMRDSLKYGLTKSLIKTVTRTDLKENINQSISHLQEMLMFINLSYFQTSENQAQPNSSKSKHI